MKLFTCQECNNEMIFNKPDGTLTCPSCNFIINVSDYEHPALGSTSNSEFISKNVQNNIEIIDSYIEPEIPFKGSPETKYYIPFKSDKNDISKLINRKFASFFMKSNFKKIIKNKAFKKIYYPVWNHSTHTTGTLNAICSDFDNNTTNYYLNEKELQVFISNLNTSASSKMIQADISSLFPYNFEDAKILPDKTSFGNADIIIDNDIPFETHTDTITEFASAVTEKNLNKYIGNFSSSYNKEYKTDTEIKSSHIIYLPIWEISFNKNMDKIYINGQTDKIIGHFPFSKLKILISFCSTSVILFALICLIIFNFVI